MDFSGLMVCATDRLLFLHGIRKMNDAEENKNMEFRPFEKRVWLSTPTMHGDEMKYIEEAYRTNWMSTVGENINEVEKLAAARVGMKYAVALSAGTAALHLAVKLA